MDQIIEGLKSDIELSGCLILSDQGGLEDNYQALIEVCETMGIADLLPDNNPEFLDESIDIALMAINDYLIQSDMLAMYHPDDPGTIIIVNVNDPEWSEA